jgi:hypothetical protein
MLRGVQSSHRRQPQSCPKRSILWLPFISAEVKVNENHIAKHTGVLGQQPPLVQPITNEVVEQLENKQPTAIKVETTKAVGH